jgi:hypothetical protein
MEAVMIITNNTDSLIRAPFKTDKDGESTDVDLKPGVNDIPSAHWREIQKIAVIGHHLKAGSLSTDDSSLPGADGDQANLAEMNIKDATRLISNTHDMALLDRWAEKEERKGVLDAIEKQQDKLKLGKNEKDEDKEPNDAA